MIWHKRCYSGSPTNLCPTFIVDTTIILIFCHETKKATLPFLFLLFIIVDDALRGFKMFCFSLLTTYITSFSFISSINWFCVKEFSFGKFWKLINLRRVKFQNIDETEPHCNCRRRLLTFGNNTQDTVSTCSEVNILNINFI